MDTIRPEGHVLLDVGEPERLRVDDRVVHRNGHRQSWASGCLEAGFYDSVELSGYRGRFALSPQHDGQGQEYSPRTERPTNHNEWQTQPGATRLPPRDFCAAALPDRSGIPSY